MKRIDLLITLWLFLGGIAEAQTLAEKLDALLASTPFLNTSEVGLAVYDLTADMPVYRYQAEKLYRPASIEKVITSVTALSELGKDYSFTTRLAYTGKIEKDTLKGDLYVIGGFDSEFMEEDLRLLADTVRRAGISFVEGKLIGDVSLMDSLYWGKGWSWDDTPDSFQPYLSPLMLNRGCVDVICSPGNQDGPGEVEVKPVSDFYKLDNRSLTGVPAAGKLKVTRNWLENGNTVLVQGNVTSRRKQAISVYRSQDFFMNTLRFCLREQGIKADSIGFAILPKQAELIYTHKRELDPILKRALKESDNLAAEALFYHLGLHADKSLPPIGSKDGQRAVYAFMRDSLGLTPKHYNIVDGSGVSLYNYISPDAMISYLKYAYLRPDIYKFFSDGLPIAGVDGTLEHRMKKGKACRRIRAKTGTVTGVSSLAGYAEAVSGRRYAFVIINQNVLKAKEARDFQDKVCEILAASAE